MFNWIAYIVLNTSGYMIHGTIRTGTCVRERNTAKEARLVSLYIHAAVTAKTQHKLLYLFIVLTKRSPSTHPPVVLPVESEVKAGREPVPQGWRVVHHRRRRAPGEPEQVVELLLHPPPEAVQFFVGKDPRQYLKFGCRRRCRQAGIGGGDERGAAKSVARIFQLCCFVLFCGGPTEVVLFVGREIVRELGRENALWTAKCISSKERLAGNT